MSNESPQFQTWMSQGHAAAWDQDWSKALQSYQQAVEENPDHPMALASMGLAHFQLRQFDEALDYYLRCSKITPEDPMPFEKMGRIYERTGLVDEAVRAFMQCGEMQLKAKDVDRAISAFKEAIRLEPNNVTVHTRLAMIYDKTGQKAEAVNEYLSTAAVMQFNGDPSKATQVLQYIQQLAPGHVEAQKALDLVKSGQQIPLPEASQDSAASMRMAQVKKMESPAGVNESLPKYDPLTETRLVALKEMAGLLFEQVDEETPASQPQRKGLLGFSRGTGSLSGQKTDRNRIQAHLSQTIDLQTAGQDDQAAAELERAVDQGLNEACTYYVLGLLLRHHQPQKSMKFLQNSVRNPNYSLASYLIMAEIHEKSGDYLEASGNYLQALRLADMQTLSADEAVELSQLYEPIFESQLKVNNEKDLRNLCSTINAQLVRSDWRDYLKEARNQLPPQPEGSPPLPLAEMLLETTSSQVVEALAVVKQLAAEGKLRTAMEEAFYALSFAPTYLPLHIQIAELLVQEGRITEATEKFMVVAKLYNIRGESSQAVRLLNRVTKLAPMDLEVRTVLIDLLVSINRLDEAVQQTMDQANTYYLLAELDLARKTYQKALNLSQNTPSNRAWSVKILNKLADIELQSLDLKAAIKIFEQIRSLDPLEPSNRSMLIDLYLRINMQSAALNELDAYLKLLSSSESAPKAIKFIDDLLADRPDHLEIQKRMVAYYHQQQRDAEIIEKLDALAEKCLKQENSAGALTTLQHLISLNPPNMDEYSKLFEELKSKNQ